MSTRIKPPQPAIVGVDFSGAVDAGRKVWVARAEANGAALQVRDVRPAAALPGGASARGPALAALVDWIAGLGRGGPCAAGMDFPFGVHRSLAEAPSLAAFVAGFAQRFPTPEAFRAASRAAGSERALRRVCDHEALTPFAAHNLRLYRQTWHGIAEVLAPLCARGARLLPQQTPTPGRLWLLETCPASALKTRGWYAPYKGRTSRHAGARERLLRHLAREGVRVPVRLRSLLCADAEGDALDSVLCAWIVWRALREPEAPRPPLTAAHRVEGYVYR